LNEGEIIEGGDECFGHGMGPWAPVLESSIGRPYSAEDFYEMRRPLPNAPTEPAGLPEAVRPEGSTHEIPPPEGSHPLPLDLEAIAWTIGIAQNASGLSKTDEVQILCAKDTLAELRRRLRDQGAA
jgi:hypothetical protein